MTLNELVQYPMICLSSHTQTYAFYSRLFLEHGIIFRPDVEAATADQILPLVASDLGIGFVPEAFLEHFRFAGEIGKLRLNTLIPPRWVCMVKPSGFALSIATQKLEEMLIAEQKEE